jgi:transmembrane protein
MSQLLSSLLVQDWFVRSALLLLTLPFWSSGLFKLADLQGALDEAGELGLKRPLLVVAATILVQLGGSFLVVAGQAAWLGAGALAVFTAWATLLAHPFWKQADPASRSRQRTILLEHLGLIGGLMLAATVSEWSR